MDTQWEVDFTKEEVDFNLEISGLNSVPSLFPRTFPFLTSKANNYFGSLPLNQTFGYATFSWLSGFWNFDRILDDVRISPVTKLSLFSHQTYYVTKEEVIKEQPKTYLCMIKQYVLFFCCLFSPCCALIMQFVPCTINNS